MAKKNVYNNFYDKESWNDVSTQNKLLLEDFMLELKQRKRADSTIAQYTNDLRIVFIFILRKLENKYILDLTKRDFRKYSLYLIEECEVSSARHNRLMSAARSLLNYAEEEDDYEYENNVARKVRGLSKEPVREIFFLTDEEVMRLKNELIKRNEYQKATLLMLAYDSAGRKAEIGQVIKDSFYDISKSNTNKVIGKRRKTFSLIYFSGTKECAKMWLDQRGEDDIESLWLTEIGGIKKPAKDSNLYDWFVSMRQIFFELEGVEKEFNVHSMRHTSLQNFAMGSHYVCEELNMEEGFPIEKLRLLANHENVDTTQGYLKDTSLDVLEDMFGIKIET